MMEWIFACSPPLSAPVQKAARYRLHFCSPEIIRFQVSPDAIRLTLSTDDESVWHEVSRKVERVVSGVRDGFVPPEERLYMERRHPSPAWSGAGVNLEQAGLIKKAGEGFYVTGPLIAGLVERLDRILLDMADVFGARAVGTPALIAPEVLSRVDYFRAFPHSLTFACHLPRDVDEIEAFSKQPFEADGSLAPAASGAGAAVLSPAVCFHLYHFLEGTSLGQALESYTVRGRCFRYEAGALAGLERLWDFTMREIVFVGEQADVMDARKRSMEWVTDLADRLGLVCRIESAADPFFVGEFKQRTVFQAAFDLKYEWRADLDPAAADDLAVGSFNVTQTHFGKAFRIAAPSGEMAWTGCTAFGLERLALAVLRQHGLSPDGWPEILKSDLSVSIE